MRKEEFERGWWAGIGWKEKLLMKDKTDECNGVGWGLLLPREIVRGGEKSEPV